jgi:uncharacterized protein (DUF427 family)
MPVKPRFERSRKRVRAYLGGEAIADSSRPLLVWERPHYPTYYFPAADVRADRLSPTGGERHSPDRGLARLYSVTSGGKTAEAAAYTYPEPAIPELADHWAFHWSAMDHWFEELEEVFVHARDPYHRIDILHSSRHVEVVVGGIKVADSRRPTLLFETGLPVRFYLPKVDVRMDLLTPTRTSTGCAYKGIAEYWSLRVNGEDRPDIVWGYRFPAAEGQKIAGLVSFYNEKVELYVDGVKEATPAG